MRKMTPYENMFSVILKNNRIIQRHMHIFGSGRLQVHKEEAVRAPCVYFGMRTSETI
jgi:hypothetical protein